jgi:hypothetical protein
MNGGFKPHFNDGLTSSGRYTLTMKECIVFHVTTTMTKPKSSNHRLLSHDLAATPACCMRECVRIVLVISHSYCVPENDYEALSGTSIQEDPPRVLAYKASAIHQYGWIPLNPFNWRNVKATVFGSWVIHAQSLALIAWTAFIHVTGLWVEEYDIRAFLKIWGTVYSGMS